MDGGMEGWREREREGGVEKGRAGRETEIDRERERDR